MCERAAVLLEDSTNVDKTQTPGANNLHLLQLLLVSYCSSYWWLECTIQAALQWTIFLGLLFDIKRSQACLALVDGSERTDVTVKLFDGMALIYVNMDRYQYCHSL